MKLYEATEAMQLVEQWLDEHDEEIAANEGAVPPALAELLEQADGDFKVKAENVGLVIIQKTLAAKAIDEEIARLSALSRSRKRQAEALKTYLKFNMNAAGMKKIDGMLCSPRLQANPPSVRASLGQDALCTLACDPETKALVRVIPESYSVETTAVVERYKTALEIVGHPPELGSRGYEQLYADWQVRLDTELRRRGVPDGISIHRGFHVRVS